LSLVGSGRVVSKFHYTDPTRPDSRTLGLQQVGRLRLFVDLSAQSRHVRTWSAGLVWSGRRQSPWFRVVELDTDKTSSETWSQARTCLVGSGPCSGIWKRRDQTRPATKSGAARVKFHYKDTDPTRPDRTRPYKVRGLGHPHRANGLCRRSGSPRKSGRDRIVESGHYVVAACAWRPPLSIDISPAGTALSSKPAAEACE